MTALKNNHMRKQEMSYSRKLHSHYSATTLSAQKKQVSRFVEKEAFKVKKPVNKANSPNVIHIY